MTEPMKSISRSDPEAWVFLGRRIEKGKVWPRSSRNRRGASISLIVPTNPLLEIVLIFDWTCGMGNSSVRTIEQVCHLTRSKAIDIAAPEAKRKECCIGPISSPVSFMGEQTINTAPPHIEPTLCWNILMRSRDAPVSQLVKGLFVPAWSDPQN